MLQIVYLNSLLISANIATGVNKVGMYTSTILVAIGMLHAGMFPTCDYQTLWRALHLRFTPLLVLAGIIISIRGIHLFRE